MNFVYAVRFGPYLKVGVTAHPRSRLLQLRYGAGAGPRPDNYRDYPAEPIFAVPGELWTERVLHTILAPHRLMGEWYSYNDEVARWCSDLLDQNEMRLRYEFITPVPRKRKMPIDCDF